MAEPTIILEGNEGTEGTPTWSAIVTGWKITGPGGIGDAWIAPVLDATDAFMDGSTSPNDGELWLDKAVDAQVTVAGRNTNINVIRMRETGGSFGTADPPELTAYDDATDAGNRTAPTTWLLIGTTGTSSVGCLRGTETESAAPGAGWTGQTHASSPGEGSVLEGDVTNEAATSALSASGTSRFNIACALPHDATAGTTTFVLTAQYTYT